ncbi:Na+/H+ antiporter NhaA [Kineococcus sp. SYSU DK003]|uniref:Na+/H+ antiporter NhaA n=1 Tax=Kineococcus sp. SYSU DK003 TaxID=3383124 RepID=UPI003D7CCCCF
MSSSHPDQPSQSSLGATDPSDAARGSGPGTAWDRTRRFLNREPVGGALLVAATVTALIWANSPAAGTYAALRDATFGPQSLHLNLSVGAWAADGLLAVFFFVVGLELKHEFVLGDLRDPRRALVPVAAAIGGVLVPAGAFLLVTAISGAGGDAARGWAIPTATDIAFAVAVLAVLGRGLPPALRIFLLTLAVVDDLIAITIIAVGYTSDLAPAPLLLALIPLALFTVLVQRRVTSWWLLLPLAIVTWALVHASGVHATVAGVLLGLVVPAHQLSERFEATWRPFSTAIAVPVFALFSAGVTVGGLAGLQASFTDPVALGIIAGLVLGKPLGITAAAWLTTKVTSARLDASLRWGDVTAAGALAGIGFTVALLVGELAFGAGSVRDEHVKVGVLSASLLAAIVGGVLLRVRARAAARGSDPTRGGAGPGSTTPESTLGQ